VEHEGFEPSSKQYYQLDSFTSLFSFSN